jgi:hypothetical protein
MDLRGAAVLSVGLASMDGWMEDIEGGTGTRERLPGWDGMLSILP